MTTASVTIGPVSAASARAWLDTARRTVDTVRARPDLEVPDDVVDAFDRFVTAWHRMAATMETFLWKGEIDPELVRHLAAHWARLVTLARTDPEGTGLRPGPPEAEDFYTALASALVEVVAVGDREGFSEHFEEVVPEFAPAGALATADASSEQEAPAAVRRVLLVDDNEDIRLLMKLAVTRDPRLEVCGEAANGAEAVEWCRHDCPDAVLLDLLMPVMDGFAALPRLKELCPNTSVVVFSAIEAPDTYDRVTRLGATTFIEKTADTKAVVAALAG